MKNLVIDTCALVLIMVGELGKEEFLRNRRTSNYSYDDYLDLVNYIIDYKRLIILPNVWTEVDNLLNSIDGNFKYEYIQYLKKLMQISKEEFIPSQLAPKDDSFYELGLTDTLLKICASKNYKLITADSDLSNHAQASSIEVYDLIAIRQARLNL